MQDRYKSSEIFTTISLMWILRVKAMHFYQTTSYLSTQVKINASEQARDCMLKCFVSKEMLQLLLMRTPAVLTSISGFTILQFLAK